MEADVGDAPEALEDGERRVLAVFIRVVEVQGRRPTYAEVAQATGYAGKESVLLVLRRLHDKGYIRMSKRKGRKSYGREAFEILRDADGRRLSGFRAVVGDQKYGGGA